jgi:hypothetical protein
MVVCAWGVNADLMPGREERVLSILGSAGIPLYCFGLTKRGHPRHPLYLRSDILPQPYEGR